MKRVKQTALLCEAVIMNVLLQYGADKNIKNNYGVSPYDLAKTITNYPVAQYLE